MLLIFIAKNLGTMKPSDEKHVRKIFRTERKFGRTF